MSNIRSLSQDLTEFLLRKSIRSSIYWVINVAAIILVYFSVDNLPASEKGEIGYFTFACTIVGSLSPILIFSTLGQLLLKESEFRLDNLLKSFSLYRKVHLYCYVFTGAVLCSISLCINLVFVSLFYGDGLTSILSLTTVDIINLCVVFISSALFVTIPVLFITAMKRCSKTTFLLLLVIYMLAWVAPKVIEKSTTLQYAFDLFNTRLALGHYFDKTNTLYHLDSSTFLLQTLSFKFFSILLLASVTWVFSYHLFKKNKPQSLNDKKEFSKPKESTSGGQKNRVEKSLIKGGKLAVFDFCYHFKSHVFILTIALCWVGLCWSIGRLHYDEIVNSLHPELLLNQAHTYIYEKLAVFLVSFYIGVSVFREKNYKISSLLKSIPIKKSTSVVSKVCSGIAIVLMLEIGAFIITAAYSGLFLSNVSYMDLLIARSFFFVRLTFLVILTVALYLIIGRQFLTFVLISFLLALDIFTYQWGYEFIVLGLLPNVASTPLNGFNGMLPVWLFFVVYWTLICTLMYVKIFKTPIRAVHEQRGALFAFGLLMLAVIVWVSGFYIKSTEGVISNIDYAKKHAGLREIKQPIVTGIYTEVDIRPSTRDVKLDIEYSVVNKNKELVELLILDIPEYSQIEAVDNIGKVQVYDKENGVIIYELSQPLQPNEQLVFSFSLLRRENYFSDDWYQARVKENSVFLSTLDSFPKLGFNPEKASTENHGSNNSLKHGSDKRNFLLNGSFSSVEYHAIISTPLHHQATTSGKLIKSWTKDDRRYFEFKSASPIAPLIPIISGEYVEHHFVGSVLDINMFSNDVDENKRKQILGSANNIATFYNTIFSGHKIDQLTIVEIDFPMSVGLAFPDIAVFSSLNSMFGQRNSAQQLADEDFLVLAHEIAHQWWGMKLIPQKNNGTKIFVESLAQYSALLALEKYASADIFNKALEEHLEQVRALTVNDQLSLFSNKSTLKNYYYRGAVGFFKIRENVGNDILNGALNKLIESSVPNSPPSVDELFQQLDTEISDLTKSELKGYFSSPNETSTSSLH